MVVPDPGEIDNRGLLEAEESQSHTAQLRCDLKPHVDYETLSPNVWNALQLWSVLISSIDSILILCQLHILLHAQSLAPSSSPSPSSQCRYGGGPEIRRKFVYGRDGESIEIELQQRVLKCLVVHPCKQTVKVAFSSVDTVAELRTQICDIIGLQQDTVRVLKLLTNME